MKEESKLLQEENRTGRMEMWWAGVVERAKEVVRDEADKRGEEMGRQTELRRDSMKRSRPVVNGVTNGERSVGDSEEEESMSVNDQEEEEDVEMA